MNAFILHTGGLRNVGRNARLAAVLACLSLFALPAAADKNSKEKCIERGGTWREINAGSGDYMCYRKVRGKVVPETPPKTQPPRK